MAASILLETSTPFPLEQVCVSEEVDSSSGIAHLFGGVSKTYMS